MSEYACMLYFFPTHLDTSDSDILVLTKKTLFIMKLVDSYFLLLSIGVSTLRHISRSIFQYDIISHMIDMINLYIPKLR